MGTTISKMLLTAMTMAAATATAVMAAQLPTKLPSKKMASYKAGNRQVEVFKATEEDGTAKEIKSSTKVESAPAPVAESAPADGDVADLKRQNAEMKKRLETLESARAEVKKQEAAEVAPAAAPAAAAAAAPAAAEKAAEKAPVAAAAAPAAPAVAPKAEIPAETAAEENVADDEMPAEAMDQPGAPAPAQKNEADVVASDPAVPTDSLEGRMKEKASVTKEARLELAKAQSREERHKALREQAGKFDNVPDRFIPDLAERLKYTNDILKRFGRAYDYRITTLSDFKQILAKLETEQEKSKDTN